MRILVTGGAGFIGSHLSDRLLEKGHSVIALDNLITGSTDNISHLAGRSDFKFINHDVTEYIYIPEDIDFIFHMASPASPIDYLMYPIQTLKVGALGTHKALGLAKEKNAGLLLASTSEVYGDPLVHPQPESYWGNVNPVGPRGVYDEAKRYAEALVFAYHRTHGVDTRIARIFNTYGPRNRADDGRVVPSFVCQALKNEDLTIFGDGEQTRSFCFVSDTVNGLIALMESGYHDPVNIGNPNEMTVKEFALEVIRLAGSASSLTYRDLPVDDPKVRKPDITTAGSVLNWKPEVSLEDGLKETIEYFRRTVL
ncbi:SDR family NAD-dependent epimerase/dehydratase [Candidatus Fermentibacteria bacterium]|nr:MAG: SDR family NAD-dependent epimerase/dehydratase [Candidatus Fermentibacteria bacterium]